MSFRSRRRRPCSLCLDPIRPGDLIVRVGGRRRFAHTRCVEAVLTSVALAARRASQTLMAMPPAFHVTVYDHHPLNRSASGPEPAQYLTRVARRPNPG